MKLYYRGYKNNTRDLIPLNCADINEAIIKCEKENKEQENNSVWTDINKIFVRDRISGTEETEEIIYL